MEAKELPIKTKKFNYSIIIIALCFLTVCITLGFCSSPASLYFIPVQNALKVDRTILSLEKSIRFIVNATMNLFFGSLVMRLGEKKLLIAGVLALAGASVVYSIAPSIFIYYLGSVLLGIGFSWTGTPMMGYVINKWCKKNKGTIMGAVLASNGLGAAVATQILSPIIESASLGYKKSFLLVACILVVLAVLLLIFFRTKPNENIAEQKEVKSKKRGADWVGIEFAEAKKKWWFYGALICIFFNGFILQSISGVAIPHMKDVGLDPVYVSVVLSISSISLACFKFLTGFMYDRFGYRITMSICSVTAVVVTLALVLVTNSPTGKVLAMFYGIFSAAALPLETIMLPIATSEFFGQKEYAKFLGVVSACNILGFAIGTPFINIFFDITGSYNVGFIVSAILMLLASIAMQIIITVARRERKKIIEQN